jgi:hypothetical protein
MAMFVFDVVRPYEAFLRGVPSICPLLRNIRNEILSKMPELKLKVTLLQILCGQQRAECERFKERCLALFNDTSMESDQVI